MEGDGDGKSTLAPEDRAWLLWFRLVLSGMGSVREGLRFLCESLACKTAASEIHVHLSPAANGDWVAHWSKAGGVRITTGPASPMESSAMQGTGPVWSEELVCGAVERLAPTGSWLLAPIVLNPEGQGLLGLKFEEAVGQGMTNRWENLVPEVCCVVGEALLSRPVLELEKRAEICITAVDESPDAITVQDRDFRIVYMNKVAQEILGIPPAEAAGVQCFRLFHGAESPPPMCPAVRALASGMALWEEKFLEPRLGRWLWVRARWVRREEDARSYLVHTVRDITRERELEDHLRASEERLRRSAEELFQSKSYLEGLVQIAPVGIFALNAEGQVVEWNDVAAQLTGLPKDRVLGQPCPFAHHAKAACRCRTTAGGTLRSIVHHWRSGAKGRRHLQVTCTRLKSREGVVGSISDMTEAVERRKQNQLLLRIANRQLQPADLPQEARSLAHALRRRTCAEAVCIYSFDPSSGEPWLLAQAGLSREKAERLREDTVYSQGWSVLRRRLAAGAPVRLRGAEVPPAWAAVFSPAAKYVTVPLRSGELSGFILLVEPMCGDLPDWQMDFLAALGREVSGALSRMSAMESLAHQTQRLGLLYDVGRALVSTLDLNTVLRSVAEKFERHMPQFLCSIHLVAPDSKSHVVKAASGPSAQDYVGRTLSLDTGIVSLAIRTGSTVYVPDIRQDHRYVCWHQASRSELAIPLISRGKVIGALNVESPQTDGFSEEDLQIFAALSALLATAVGNVLLFEETVRTSEELAIERAKALEASNLKSQFLSNVSHELRTPLNAILGYTQHVLQQDRSLSEDSRESLRRVIASGRQLLQLINDLLDLSKIEAGRLEINRQPVDLRKLVLGCLATIEPGAREKGLQLRLELPAGSRRVHTDPLRLQQILLNLLSNAVKFTDQGEVLLRVREDERWLAIDVVDSGIGIDPAYHEVIFESFRQVDGSPTRKAGGTGLGLAISRKLARLLGGDLTVESEPGKGSTFTLRIPYDPGLLQRAQDWESDADG
ncbi:MAG: ATP-binding protein [candidate division KSB1 bacterium]|nr:ATP-binding protein [candidate division KSB1 bacterium]